VPANVPVAVQVFVASVAIVADATITGRDLAVVGSVKVNAPPLMVAVPVKTRAAAEAISGTGIDVPAKDAAVIETDVVETVLSPTDRAVGKPDAETLTDVPAGPVAGERVTIGAVMVKVTGDATSPEVSVI